MRVLAFIQRISQGDARPVPIEDTLQILYPSEDGEALQKSRLWDCLGLSESQVDAPYFRNGIRGLFQSLRDRGTP